jgi:sialic acid synthase
MEKLYKQKPVIIAEIGCNHKGSFEIAKKMILEAKKAGAEYVKFQKRNNKFLLGDKYNLPHPVQHNSYGKTYGKHRDFLEFNIATHKKLFNFCKKVKVKYSVSVWEKKSAYEFIKSKLKLDYIKVPSACNLDFELLETLASKFKGKIHISTGMTTRKEIDKIFNFFKKKGRNKDLVIYSCTSDYPAKNEDVCLLEIEYLKKKYGKKIEAVAFSGHHLGISIDIASFLLGAKFIERHFTLDRTWKGTDHAASLEPQGLNKLCRDILTVKKSLTYKNKLGLLKSEKFQRKKLKNI